MDGGDRGFAPRGDGTDNLVVGSTIDDASARPLVARSSGYRMDLESETFVVGTMQQSSLAGKGTFGWDEDPSVSKPVKTQDDGQMIVVADPISAHEGKTYTHEGRNNFRTHNVINGVRRLTPLECERLMGWGDDHTRYTADGKEIPDSHRYRMIGNGVVAPVAEWLGQRLVEADRWT